MKTLKLKIASRSLIILVFPLILLFLILAFSSCKDNPVSTKKTDEPKVIDSACFSWSFIPFNHGTVYDLYALDTNKIFIASSDGTFLYNGSSFIQIDINTPDFIVKTLGGYDENNIYLGGGGAGQFINHARLKKWNGSSIQEIQMPADSTKNVSYIYAKDINNIWISSDTNKLYHCDGNNINNMFYLPIGMLKDCKIYPNNNGNTFLYVVWLYSQYFSSLWEYSSNSWTLIYSDTIHDDFYQNSIVGYDIIKSDYQNILYLKLTGWLKITQTIDFNSFSLFSGISKVEFITNALDDGGKFRMYLFKNNQWFLDTNYNPPDQRIYNQIYRLKYIENTYIGIFDYPYDYLIIGRKTKKNREEK